LLVTLDALAADPFQQGDFQVQDASLRQQQV
jgi:hypothetical protein